ncbi:hypothetical protein JIN85_11820 [Luteolibacter pohnpeiensis]|uniref:Uncharacterized protein n=1 Tax=Luteolibacter pohnpeiensis TaxID=454153 RepID=A0A934S770_9BACT|nr:hypothetical protein [Luteolibacter pohnpeiensis]MBK1883108.1 hypothetical protein [Luteolibacter pohnpeiensis]
MKKTAQTAGAISVLTFGSSLGEEGSPIGSISASACEHPEQSRTLLENHPTIINGAQVLNYKYKCNACGADF